MLLMSMAVADDETPSPGGRLATVLVTDSGVLASDGARLYKAPKGSRNWRLVATPKEMSQHGEFISFPGALKPLLFHPVRSQFVWVWDDPKGTKGHILTHDESWKYLQETTYGLYGAGLEGAGWELLTDEYDFWSVVPAAGGLLYALAAKHKEPTRKDRILRSKDGGRTWVDITNNAMDLGVGGPERLIPDPDHPSLVCVEFQGVRGYILQAKDDTFKWTPRRETKWWEEHKSGREFFNVDFGYHGVENGGDYIFDATFGNYFLHPFGNRTSIEPFELTLDKAAYDFSVGEAKEVTVTLCFRREDHSAAILDLIEATDFWGVRVENASGRYTVKAAVEARADLDFVGSEKDYKARPDLVRKKVIGRISYSRKLDLAKLADLSKPGVSTIQLRYALPYGAGEGRTHWNGSFGSAPVTITVRAR
jgi:hypothetical protein